MTKLNVHIFLTQKPKAGCSYAFQIECQSWLYLPLSHNMPKAVAFDRADTRVNWLLLCSPSSFEVDTYTVTFSEGDNQNRNDISLIIVYNKILNLSKSVNMYKIILYTNTYVHYPLYLIDLGCMQGQGL